MEHKRREGYRSSSLPRGKCLGGSFGSAPKVDKIKDLTKVLDYFRYKVGTTLDCAQTTSVLRNSITWYVDYLQKVGLLKVVKVAKDQTTGYFAKHYSADEAQWGDDEETECQLNLFAEWGI
jgi:hypothetical protein